MIRPLNLEEFAQQLRVSGDYQEAEFADEILYLFDLDEEVAQPYNDLCDDIRHYAPEALKEQPAKALEWLGNRSAELEEIYDLFSADELGGENIPDQIKERFEALENFEEIIRKHGGWTEGDLQDGLFALIERADKVSKQEYDL